MAVSLTPEGTGSRVTVVGRVHRKLAENIGGVLETSLKGKKSTNT